MPVTSDDFLGIDPDVWTAGASVLGPALAVIAGLLVFRLQQESHAGAERFITNGVQRLHGTLSALLSLHLQNYQIALYLLRTGRIYRTGHWLTPKADELPRMLGLELESLPIDSLLPVQVLLGHKVVLEWTMLALSDVTLEAKEWDFQVRRPFAAYLRADPADTTDFPMNEALEQLNRVVEGWQKRTASHFALLDRLNDLARLLDERRPWRLKGYYRVHERSDIATLRQEFENGLAESRQIHQQTEAMLKSGGISVEDQDA